MIVYNFMGLELYLWTSEKERKKENENEIDNERSQLIHVEWH